MEGKEGIEKTRTWRNEKHDTEEEGPGRNVRDPPQIAATPSKPMPLPAAPSSFLLHPVVLIPADDPARDYASVPPPPPPSSRPALHLPPPVLSSARPPTRARRLTGGEARFHRLDSTQFPTSARLTLEKSISKSAKGWSKGGGGFVHLSSWCSLPVFPSRLKERAGLWGRRVVDEHLVDSSLRRRSVACSPPPPPIPPLP